MRTSQNLVSVLSNNVQTKTRENHRRRVAIADEDGPGAAVSFASTPE